MSEPYVFPPPRRTGTFVHAGLILLTSAIGLLGLWLSSRADVGPVFMLYLAPAVLAVVLLPVLTYYSYALQGAGYQLERDGIKLRWGLRTEEIPMDQVQWLATEEELNLKPPLPWLRLPGAVIGLRRLGDGTLVEYMASRSRSLVFIAASGRVFAVSPSDPARFMDAYSRLAEMGTLSPIPAKSVYPSLLISRFWADRPARSMAILGAFLSLVLFTWVTLAIPSHNRVVLYTLLQSSDAEHVPGVQLLLLPVLNAVIFIVDMLVGLFFYRRTEPHPSILGEAPPPRGLVGRLGAAGSQPLAYLVWGSGLFTGLLFLGAVFYILRSG